ncbi:MAG: DoxX family protein [Candidatus Pacebacteria bacterium]|nr:DoxX family protein [Candidatus Paceibacterota bacterium]MBP9867012.1 DoxX family protein [Candidatus Paceibacterota bacterium]
MKSYYPLVSRSLIALLFVFAGIQKITEFTGTTTYVDALGVPFPVLATILVIIIEVPIALMFVFCPKRVCASGLALIAFTILATALAHNPFTATDEAFKMTLTMALKNIAIIGGILAAIMQCECDKCLTTKKEGAHTSHKK